MHLGMGLLLCLLGGAEPEANGKRADTVQCPCALPLEPALFLLTAISVDAGEAQLSLAAQH